MSEKLKELKESMNLATLLYLQELRKIKYETFVEETKNKSINEKSPLYSLYFGFNEITTKKYKKLLLKVHPDKNIFCEQKATVAFKKLTDYKTNSKVINDLYEFIDLSNLLDLITDFPIEKTVKEQINLIKREYWYLYYNDPLFNYLFVEKENIEKEQTIKK